MELGVVKLCCAAVVQVSSAKASPGNRASKRSAGDLIGTLPVKATAALGLTRDSAGRCYWKKNQEPSYGYRKQTCGCFRRCALGGIRIASLGATGRKSTATLDRPWTRA